MSKLRNCKITIELNCVLDTTDKDTIKEDIYSIVQDAMDAEELEYIVEEEEEEEE